MTLTNYNAWIEPNGRMHYCGLMEHNSWASDYLENKYGFKNMYNLVKKYASVESYMHSLGWVRLKTWTIGKTKAIGDCWDPIVFDNTVDPSLTKQQRSSLKEWCIDHNYDFEKLFQ